MVTTQDISVLLQDAPPRQVPHTLRDVALRGQWQFVTGIAVGTIICAIIFVAFFPWSISKAVRLSLWGIPAQGKVVESFYGNRTIGDNIIVRKRQIFWVRFNFIDAAGAERRAASMFDKHLAANTRVRLTYLPTNPKIAKLDGGFFVPGGLLEVFWASMFLIFPALGFWNYLRWRRNRLQLLSHGVCVEGQLERVWREDPKDETRGWIEVSYATPEGPFRHSQVVEDRIFTRASAIIQQRTTISILYAPKFPRRHIIVDLMA